MVMKMKTAAEAMAGRAAFSCLEFFFRIAERKKRFIVNLFGMNEI
jgi:hypothetical protein